MVARGDMGIEIPAEKVLFLTIYSPVTKCPGNDTEFRSSLPKKWSLADVMLLVSQLSVPPKCWNQWFPSQDQPVPKSPMLPTPFLMVLTVLCFQEKISKFSILPSLGGNHNRIILWSLKRWNCQGRIPSWIRLYHVKDCPRCRRCSF